MKKTTTLLLFFVMMLLTSSSYSQSQFKVLDANNIKTRIYETGIFDQNLQTSNTPGMEWIQGSGKFATFSSGLTIAAKVNDSIRMAAASFSGEFRLGYINGSGVAVTDSRFRVYKVYKDDNNSNPDYADWWSMVPFGAPYQDVNSNGQFDIGTDKPGIPGADQTIFLCITDGFFASHNSQEGFGGGTQPLYAQVAATFWAYDTPVLDNVYFAKWDITNKSTSTWNSAYFSIIKDIDIGDPNDDYIGTDTVRQLVYSYNGDNMDGTGTGLTYGANPPSVGVMFLHSPAGLTTSSYFTNTSSSPPPCESDPNGDVLGAYNMMRGYKKDATPWLVATSGPSFQTTKFLYSGNPINGAGWTEIDGKVNNCGGALTGSVTPNPPGDRRTVMSSGADDLSVAPGQKKTIIMGKVVARGTDNLNSVSQLTIVSDDLKQRYISGQLGVVGVSQIGEILPSSYKLEQNFPNPFNPSTNIRFSVPEQTQVKLVVYDALGKEVAVLVNSSLTAGTYNADFNASKLSSGIYYYTLRTDKFTETKKMLLIK